MLDTLVDTDLPDERLKLSSSESEDSKVSSSSELTSYKRKFNVVPVTVLIKATRQWARSLKQKQETDNKATQVDSKFLLSFEEYLGVVCAMYYGDVEITRTHSANPLKRPRGGGPLEVLLSPLREEYVFGTL